jgi:hypothetical protein
VTTQTAVLRERRRAGALVAVAVVLIIIGVALLAGHSAADDAGPRLLGAAFVIVGVGVALWSRRSVTVDDDSVVLRYVARRRRLAWSDVRCFDVRTIRRNRGERQERPVAELTSGETVLIPGADPMWFPNAQPHTVVAELEMRRRAAERRPDT